MAFPGSHTFQRFLAKTSVGPDSSGTNWLLCVESDLKTVQDLMANLSAHQVIRGNEAAMEYCVFSARRYAQTMVYVLLQWECTFSQLDMAFGEASGLLGRLIKEHYFYVLKDFLLGAKGTSIGEWSTFFSAEDVEFSQELLNVLKAPLQRWWFCTTTCLTKNYSGCRSRRKTGCTGTTIVTPLPSVGITTSYAW